MVLVNQNPGREKDPEHVILFLRVGAELSGLAAELSKKGFAKISNLEAKDVNRIYSRQIGDTTFHAFVISSHHPRGDVNAATLLKERLSKQNLMIYFRKSKIFLSLSVWK